MNTVVRHILVYAGGILSGVALTLLIIKVMEKSDGNQPEKMTFEKPKEIVKTDTVEKVVYKKPQKVEKENATFLDTLGNVELDTLNNLEDTLQDININREVLVAVKNFTVQTFSRDTSQSNALRDSLGKSMGINSDKNLSSIRVEFWKSPLNFEGYILGKSMVRLYGINEVEPLKFYLVDNKIYMKKASKYYTLIRSEEYHKFELSKENIHDKILQISGNG